MIHDHLEQRAALNPDSEFAVQGDRCIRAGEAAQLANRLANALLSGGIRIGDRVAILSRNSIEFTLLFFAISRAGAVAVPLNFRSLPKEWRFILDDSAATVLFAAPEFVSRIETIRPELPGLRRFIAVGEAPKEGWESWEALLLAHSSLAPPVVYGEDPDALQLYTSGTTGVPKGVVLTQEGWEAATGPAANPWGCASGERALLVLPLFHIFGLALTCLSARWGSCLYILDDFNPIETVRVLDEKRIAFAAMVPSMIQACLIPAAGAAKRKFASLRLIAYGASPIAEVTLRRAIETLGCGFLQLYGLTEFSPISELGPEDHRRALRGKIELLLSAGRACQGVELQVVDPQGQAVPTGTPGEILVRGIHGMRCYWNLPEPTAEAISKGWIHTGDVGYLDPEGYIYIQDRMNDTIISGGENIYPHEVESTLARMPEVEDVAVIGVPHDLWGESVKAVIVLRRGATLTDKEVMAFGRSQIAAYKVPGSVDFVEQLPRNPSGKVLKRQLREPYWTGRQRLVGGA